MGKIVYKPVWSEGLFLKPQHFQQFERYFEALNNFKNTSYVSFFWGFTELKVNLYDLSQGRIVFEKAEGIFPDGTPFRLNVFSKIDNFTLHNLAHSQKLYLVIPNVEIVEKEVFFTPDLNANDYTKYNVIEREVDDICDINKGSTTLQLAELNMQIITEVEYAEGDWIGLPFLKVLEMKGKEIIIDNTFIPPILYSGINLVLVNFMKEINALLNARVNLLKDRMQRPGRSGVSEVSEFILLNVINKYRGSLNHLLNVEKIHPEILFREYLMLASELASFTTNTRSIEKFPLYQHEDLYLSFIPLVIEIRQSLTTILDEIVIKLPLIDIGNGLLKTTVPDLNLFSNSDFILAVYADIPVEDIRTKLPSQIKLGPIDKILDLVHLQIPGIVIKLLTNVPRQIPYSAGYLYFGVEKQGELWQDFAKNGVVAFHVSGNFPSLDLEFWAVRAE